MAERSHCPNGLRIAFSSILSSSGLSDAFTLVPPSVVIQHSYFPRLTLLLGTLACLFFALPVAAQQKRISPHETISRVVDGGRVTIVYGRPYSADPKTGKVREIWGKVVSYGEVWRAGADEATLLITQKALIMGGVTIPAGAYSLFFLPEATGTSKLIVNRQIGHWGTQYDSLQDLARIDVTKEAPDSPTDQFTFVIDRATEGGGVLRLVWADTQYAVAFKSQN